MASVTSLRKLLDAIIGEDGSARSKFVDGTTLSILSTLTLGQCVNWISPVPLISEP